LTNVPPLDAPAYDAKPESVVVFARMKIEPGAPRPTVPGGCSKPFVPTLRIYGDGYAFVNLRIYGDGYAFVNDPPNQSSMANVRSGLLKPNTLPAILAYLRRQGFFGGTYKPAPANPAGTSIDWGVNAAGSKVDYGEGSFDPPTYVTVVAMVEPELKPLAQQPTLDPRVDGILRNEYCDMSR
jgi:hypothetical protein